MFQKIQPYFESGKDGKFKIRGRELRVWDIQDFSDVIDDAFMTVIDRQTEYVKETVDNQRAKTLFENGRKISPEDWKAKQINKLEGFNNPPDPNDYPTVTIKNTSKVGMGDDRIYVIDGYKRVAQNWRGMSEEVRQKIIDKAKTLIDEYPMERNAAGRAYLKACKLHFIPNNANRNQLFGA
jgi:hypothetical protein